MARLILSLDNQVLAEYNMTKERYTIGRLPDNDVRIDNPAVSGHHSLIINILNDSFLEDLNSTNGTYVNGKLIKKHALQHGDVITIGHHQLRHTRGKAIVVTVTNLVGRNRVVLIDDGDDAALQQAPECAPGIEKPSPVLGIFRREQHLCRANAVCAEHFLVGMNQLHLSGRCGGLQIFKSRPALVDS